MNTRLFKAVLLFALAVTGLAVPARGAYHTFQIVEVFSSVDRTVQFVRMHEVFNSDGQGFLNTFGCTLTSSSGATTNTYTFPSDLPFNTAGRDILIGTANLTTLCGVTPDYIIPANFLFLTNGTVSFNPFVSTVTYTTLPTNGLLSAFFSNGVQTGTANNTPKNFNNATGTINVPPGSCCVGTVCNVTVQISCSGTWTGGGTCAGNPCVPATGACCAGATCSVTSQAGCTGAFRRFAGNGSACNAPGTTTPCCYGDFNQVDGKTVQDLFDFLGAWFALGPFANINGGTVTVQDLFDFLAAWFAGCA